MLLDLVKELKPDNPLGGNPTGTVVAVDKAGGRCKMIIKGYLEGAIENLPWCYPKNPPDQGGQQDASHHQMPDLNSELMTSFVGGTAKQMKREWRRADPTNPAYWTTKPNDDRL